jgi:DNA-binding NtrC family response regulator
MTARPLDRAGNGTLAAAEAAPWETAPGTAPDARPVGAKDSARVCTAIVVSRDEGLRQRLAARLMDMRWQVREASGGAQAMLLLEEYGPEAMLLDNWLADLQVDEFAGQVRLLYPETDLLLLDGVPGAAWDGVLPPDGQDGTAPSPRRNELLHAIREARESATKPLPAKAADGPAQALAEAPAMGRSEAYRTVADGSLTDGSLTPKAAGRRDSVSLPELVGDSPAMRELVRLMRMVAPRSTTVLIEGETGTGKEVVARALHRLSLRAERPFVVLNCAAIPESLLEAELFGHTRGAFTGAVKARMGRIEMAHGGTLLLDEIGEMPLGMQAKMLRFLESGELQRVGDNQMTRVDVRLIAATHQPLEQRSAEGTFRLDLYHRLAVFPIEVPPLRERMEDIAALTEHILERLGMESPHKRLAPAAAARLHGHTWPGNVRELMHVLERGAILAGAHPEIAAADIRYRRTVRS